MGSYTLNAVNTAVEAIMIIVLSSILLFCFREKKRFFTTSPLMLLTFITVLVLINHIITRSLSSFYLNTSWPVKLTYVLDYFFGYFEGFAFFLYVETLAKDGYKQNGVEYNISKKTTDSLIIIGLVFTFIYETVLFNTSLLNIENGITYVNVLAYIVMHITAKVACIYALITIVKHKRVIRKNEAIILSSFIFIPMFFIFVDEIFNLCISYMILAFIIIILFIRINLQRELLFEKQERNLVERQTEIMLSQMQPHFLYNVLTTISALCEKQGAVEARDVTNRFADYFRVNLDSLGKDKTIPFTKELEHIQTYLWLEKVRFEDYLNINYEIGPTDFNVPSLSIQPIVENAVKHGILKKDTAGTLTIKTFETDKEYLVIVEDDGVGFDMNKKQDDGKSHVGIENVSKRLELVCNGLLEVQSEINKGTTVKIHIPKGAK